MKRVRVTKIVTEIKFEEVWGKFRNEKKFPQTMTQKIFETNSIFQVN